MLNVLLEQVKNAIFNSSTTPHQPGHDPDGLIGQISGLFGQHQEQMGTMQNPLPASQDPYGDPADQFPGQYSNAQYPGNRAYATADLRGSSLVLGPPAKIRTATPQIASNDEAQHR